MTKEQLYFIQLLSDHLNSRKTECVNDLDWEILHHYAQKHQVNGIFYVQAKDNMPLEVAKKFSQEMLATFYYQSSKENEMMQIKQALDEAEIPFFIVKGPVVAQLYPIPKLRVMGDIDLVIHTNDREACHNLLIKKGFTCFSKQEDREWQYNKNYMELELHDHLVYEEAVNEKGQDVFFNDCWRYVKNDELDWNFHLLFLIFHLRKHLMNSGVGFRQFMDLSVVAQSIEIDWEWLENNLKKTGMFEFAKKCYGFIDRWFGIHTPLSEKVDDQFYEQATEKIFADGIFGFGNGENANSYVINQIRHNRFPKIGMIRLAFSQLFPSRKELKDTDPYTYLGKYPILLPIAWIHRMIRGSNVKKLKVVTNVIKNSFISNDQIEKRVNMLNKWGL